MNSGGTAYLNAGASALTILLLASALPAAARPAIMAGFGGHASFGTMVWHKWKSYEAREHSAVGGLFVLIRNERGRSPDFILSLGSGYLSTRHDRKQ
ncbi:MAG: hypothetical protein E4G96_08850, partial [Chrysiogenales bacterium]